MRLLAFKEVTKGSLRGFADVELPIGLVILECPVHRASNGRPWAALPAKAQVDSDGRQRRDERGKPAYSPVLKWRSDKLREAFSARVVELVAQQHPEIFNGGGTS
jgi:hypothetical protein